MDKENLQLTQANILIRCVQHIAYYKILSKEYKIKNTESPFWTATIDAHILQAVTQWNMLFGKGSSNHYHWKQNLSNKKIESFRSRLDESLGEGEWESIWQDMTTFRDKYAAHRDNDFNGVVPNLSKALKVLYVYDEWVYDNDLTDVHISNLKNVYTKLCQEIAPMLHLLLDIDEKNMEVNLLNITYNKMIPIISF